MDDTSLNPIFNLFNNLIVRENTLIPLAPFTIKLFLFINEININKLI